MSITDSTFSNLTGEVRLRQACQFQQIPNNVEAGEELANGMFVRLATNGHYVKATNTFAATHLVLKSGEPRVTHQEIVELTGSVQEGEPVMAITGGPGTVSIPFAESVSKGDQLMVNAEGYAIKKSGACFVVGIANEDVDVDDPYTAFGEALITLPATYRAS